MSIFLEDIFMDTILEVKQKRNILIALYIFAILSFICACDAHSGQRPTDYPNSVWACTNPNIRLIVQQNREMYFEIHDSSAQYPNDTIVGFDYGNRIIFHSNDLGDDLFVCRCVFSPEKMTAVVTKDELFDGKYTGQQIEFVKED